MDSESYSWISGDVNITEEHFELRYEENEHPSALIGKGEGDTFIVQFLINPDLGKAKQKEVFEKLVEEIEFYLINKREENPWEYAKYHCSTGANIYSTIHWGYFPRDYFKE